MTGKLLAGFIVIVAAVAGVAMYYLQEYGYYDRVVATGDDVHLTTLAGVVEPILYDGFEAVDATSSPIRYRACFTSPMSMAMMSETYKLYPEALPLTGPSWFDCYNAQEVGEALESGAATAYLGQQNVIYGIDRVVAVFEDGRGMVWHQINPCGEAAFDGKTVPADCPPLPKEMN